MAASVALNLKSNARQSQLTYTAKIGDLVGGQTPNFVLPDGVCAYAIVYSLAGAGSLQMQKSANDPREALNTNTPLPQLWLNAGTASTGGTVQGVEGSGSPTQLKGVVTGGAAGDILTVCISAACSS